MASALQGGSQQGWAGRGFSWFLLYFPHKKRGCVRPPARQMGPALPQVAWLVRRSAAMRVADGSHISGKPGDDLD